MHFVYWTEELEQMHYHPMQIFQFYFFLGGGLFILTVLEERCYQNLLDGLSFKVMAFGSKQFRDFNA